MLQAFIEIKDKLPLNTDIMCAAEGFEQLGYIVRTFEKTDIITEKFRLLYPTCPFVGGFDTMKKLFTFLNVLPPAIDFPPDLAKGRRITQMSLQAAVDSFRYGGHPVFIKPVETKLFGGMLLKDFPNIHYFEPFLDANPLVWVSPEVKFISEWRGFVKKSELVDLRQYSGSFRVVPDLKDVDKMVENSGLAIAAYTLDIGVTEDLETLLVEANDFWAIGSYGLAPQTYAQMLADRYFEVLDEG
jgi:hypothetical protein